MEVIDAMIDDSEVLEIEGDRYNEKGQILTLTNLQAEKKYGGKPLLSLGTVDSINDLIAELGYAGAKIVRIEPTGAERLASWLTALGPLLLLAGVVGIYIEMKTPGFGLPGIIGIVSFALYFLGGFIAGLSGLEWTVVFIIGLALFIVELFVLPGTMFLGLVGGGMMLAALVMAMVDVYPGMPAIPSFRLLRESLLNVLLTLAGAIVVMMLLSRYLLTTPLYRRMIATGASGATADATIAAEQKSRLGEVGTTVSPLRPGGKAQFGGTVLDVVSNGGMIPRSTKVRIIAFSGREPIVEPIDAA
jgi:membrane-bound serine protease (ClpP class)